MSNSGKLGIGGSKVRRKTLLKTCKICGQNYFVEENFFPTNSPYFPDGHLDICKGCVERIVPWRDLGEVDRFCRYADYAFLADEYANLMPTAEEKSVVEYCERFYEAGYRGIGWAKMNEKIGEKIRREQLDLDIKVLREEKLQEYRQRWGEMEEEDYLRLENYYIDMHASYIIQTASHRDYLRKICKLSLLIDKTLDQGGNVGPLINSYDKMMKSAGFTEADVQARGAITSIGELTAMLEKHGFTPRFYNHEAQDIVDATIANVQDHQKRLVEGEPMIHEVVEGMKENIRQKQQLEERLLDSTHYDNMKTRELLELAEDRDSGEKKGGG